MLEHAARIARLHPALVAGLATFERWLAAPDT
jgi:hypothetical protein